MATLPKLIPPPDLLSQVGGIEQGLQRGRRVRWLGAIAAALQAFVVVANSEWFNALLNLNWDRVLDQAWMLAPLLGAIIAFVLATSARVWLRESREPFRYTFSVAPFAPMAGAEEEPKLKFLSDDLLELISSRIRRLSRHDVDDAEAQPEPADGQGADALSHIHITGSYAKRLRPPRKDPLLEVTTWIRIGPPAEPLNLAHPVKFRMRDTSRNGAEPAERSMTDDDYEDVIERVYFSVATEIYRRIQQDVRRKIDLLPRRYFRAIAYFHEAEDYGRSNTLDAYDEARNLYADALRTYDPTWGAAWSPKGRPRPVLRLRQMSTLTLQWVRRRLSYVWPRLARIEVLIAKALLGYANSLLYRRILAAQLGMSQNPIFEAKPLAERALRRLEQMSRRVPERDETLFAANTTLAFAYNQMGWDDEAEQRLARARSIDPMRTDVDARYTFVAGLLEGQILSAIRVLRRTVELDPAFEAAQFELAKRHQMLWESQRTLERNVARYVAEEYEKVLALNPGNLAAWAARAHMSWLLGDLDAARHEYESGRQYKEIVQEAFVVSIDWGLARVTAEAGDFDAAYRHYINAASGLIAQGRSYDEFRYTAAQIDPINDVVRMRFEDYLREVRHKFRDMPEDSETSPRIARSVRAFAYNDYGWALQQNYHRTGQEETYEEAKRAYKRAMKLNPNFVLPYYNLYWATRGVDEEEPPEAKQWLDKVHEREPAWPEANMLMLARWAEGALQAEQDAKEAQRKGDELRREAQQHARRARAAYYNPEQTLQEGENVLEQIERGLLPAANLARRPVREAQDYRERAIKALEDAKAEARRAAELMADSTDLRGRVDEVAPLLLPQEWLWKRDGGFDWGVFTGWRKRRGCRRNLIWERSFDDFHARALFHWGRAQRRGGREPGLVQAVFRTIAHSFWPNDFDLLREQREIGEDLDVESLDDKIISIVERWIQVDGSTFWTLQWLTTPTFQDYEPGSKLAVREIRRIARREDLSPGLYTFLADALKKLHDPDDAELTKAVCETYERACDRAVEEGEYARVLYVGDQIRAIRGPEAGDSCYAKVHQASRPELLREVAERYVREDRPKPAWDKAVEVLVLALKIGPQRDDEPQYRRTLARSFWALKQYDSALDEIAKTEPEARFKGHWRTDMANEFETFEREARMRIREWLVPRQRAAVMAGERDDAIDAGCALLKATSARPPAEWEKDEDERRSPDAPLAEPLVLEVDARIFDGDGKPTLEDARRKVIPEMLARVREQRGLQPVVAPLKMVAADHERYYRVLVNEVPLEAGAVPAEANGSAAREFVLNRLEELLTLHLWRFADSAMVAYLLGSWESGDLGKRPTLREKHLPDAAANRRFVQIVRELVREEVPVTESTIEPILTADRSGSLFQGLERARRAIKDDLPGRDREIVPMPDAIAWELEDAWRATGGRTLPLSVEVDEAIKGILTENFVVDGAPRDISISVTPSGLRPHAARLINRHLPGIPVLSLDECPPAADAPAGVHESEPLRERLRRRVGV